MTSFLISVFQSHREQTAIVWRDEEFSYGWLLSQLGICKGEILKAGIPEGAVVSLESDYSPYSVAWMLALVEHQCIYVPLSYAALPKKDEYFQVGQVEWEIRLEKSQQHLIRRTEHLAEHAIYNDLRSTKTPGLVLFSSGSTGKSKAAVHDFKLLLEKFKIRKQKKTILSFLLFDHIGGLNTLLYTISNGGTLVAGEDRSPEGVSESIQKYKVQILPTSPTFCNLLIIREIAKKYSLDSLELVTYGTEVMPEFTLKKMNELFPKVKFQQTYGLSEIGIMRSKSESNDSLWVKIGGEGFQTRVVDGMLEVQAQSAMKGYLNAPSPFTEDGWFKTGDAVEEKDGFLKILGRKSEIINVGGEKVFPSEIESALLKIDGVEDCVVFGEKHPLVGQIVVAKIVQNTPEQPTEFRVRIKKALLSSLETFKVPQKIIIVEEELFGARFKRSRNMGV